MDQQKRIVNVMNALGDETRFEIFRLLMKEENHCVSEVAAAVGISVSAASQHFRIFELVGLVHKRRDGQKVCYALAKDNTTNMIKKLVKET